MHGWSCVPLTVSEWFGIKWGIPACDRVPPLQVGRFLHVSCGLRRATPAFRFLRVDNIMYPRQSCHLCCKVQRTIRVAAWTLSKETEVRSWHGIVTRVNVESLRPTLKFFYLHKPTAFKWWRYKYTKHSTHNMSWTFYSILYLLHFCT